MNGMDHKNADRKVIHRDLMAPKVFARDVQLILSELKLNKCEYTCTGVRLIRLYDYNPTKEQRAEIKAKLDERYPDLFFSVYKDGDNTIVKWNETD